MGDRGSAKLGVTAAYLARLELGAGARAYQGMRATRAGAARRSCGPRHQARDADDPVLLADIALAATTTWTSAFGDDEWARSLLEEARSALGDADGALQVRLLARLATKSFHADPDESARCSLKAVAIAESMRDDTLVAEALLSERLALSREPTACRARLDMSAKALRLAGEDPGVLGLRIRRELLTDLLQCAELERFESELDRYEREGRDLSSPRRHLLGDGAARHRSDAAR